MSKGRVLELFYDVVSSYSWLGFEIMCRYKNIWNVDVQFRPGFLGGIMQATGNSPPAMVPKKGAYMAQDMERLSEYYQVPLKQPGDFFQVVIKKGSLSAMRFVTAVQLVHPEFVEPVSRELWRRIWSEAAKKAGMPEDVAKKVLATISSPEVKNKLKETTESALKYGVFGMPSIVAHINGKPQLYFGSDRFELLAHKLGEKWYGPVPQKSHL
ncbi:PREDICTED: glutathione S-transferase kappa 1-like isoform X2 [Nanorana parkeri]|uniref:glutathione S-transferase kappa 1-like isoform X2 n=1 Tax=Nanorana parkeri TaxID=125878 RepID=UPI000854CFBC|nr:PREDICTED: glutathione S-transferase kappa 1-like isoform X2 [Nanorana parkeri]